jgi:hypothetical protein
MHGGNKTELRIAGKQASVVSQTLTSMAVDGWNLITEFERLKET